MLNAIINISYTVGFIWFLLALHLLLSKPADRMPVRLLALNSAIWSIQALLLAARLAWEWELTMIARPIIAATLGPAIYFYYLAVSEIKFKFHRYHVSHLTPSLIIAWVIFTDRQEWGFMIDYLIIISLAAYSSILVYNLLFKGGGNLQHLGEYVKDAYLWLWIISGMMIISVLTEIIIFIEILLGRSLSESIALGISSCLFLLFTAFTLLCFLRRSPLFEWMYSLGVVRRQKYAQSKLTQEICDRYFQQLESFMNRERPYTAGRVKIAEIAKRIEIPARQLSEVINRRQGVSFSRYLNDFRIRDAKHLLEHTPQATITDIMFETGFYTKSSFNQEFIRVVGLSPTAYRQKMI
jgi:AraC-like DNA-binding protein